MTKHALVRIFILIGVTIIFISSFYFFFKNSRASSPRNNKEYMQRLETLSNRYQVAGSISPTPIQKNTSKNSNSFLRIIEDFIYSLN